MVDVPTRWYNIVADLSKPLPPLMDPFDDRGSRIQLLVKILPSILIDQEYTLERYITIPEKLREAYRRVGRPTPFLRAEGLERAIGVYGRVRIYYKAEGFLPTNSHKINTALAQAYYALEDGAKEVVTETGAGQWGLAAATAAALLCLKATIFMTRSSYHSKRGRRLLMQVLGAAVYPSPSDVTEAVAEHWQRT